MIILIWYWIFIVRIIKVDFFVEFGWFEKFYYVVLFFCFCGVGGGFFGCVWDGICV